MTTIDDLLVSVTARLKHQVDFTFEHSNMNAANLLRSRFLSESSFGGLSNLQGISIDEDDDIILQTNERNTWYLTKDSVMVLGQIGTLKDLSNSEFVDGLSRIIEWLYKQRSEFWPELYEVRLLFWKRLRGKDSLAALDALCHASLRSVFGEAAPSSTHSFRLSTGYDKGPFVDSLELNTSNEAQLRYSRTSPAKSFESYGAFLRKAELGGLVEGIKPVLETFIVEQQTLGFSPIRPLT
jgi:hypothetical protein